MSSFLRWFGLLVVLLSVGFLVFAYTDLIRDPFSFLFLIHVQLAGILQTWLSESLATLISSVILGLLGFQLYWRSRM